jgi:hypothetical protein
MTARQAPALPREDDLMLRVRPARPGDAADLAGRLREADRREIRAVVGQDPLPVLEEGVAWSDPCLGVELRDGRLVGLFGAGPDADRPGVGVVWLVGSEELVRYPLSFLRLSRVWLKRLHEAYPVLDNCVDVRNEVHVRWLRWCRFETVRRIEHYGVERRPFLEFRRVRGGGGTGGTG